MLIYIQPLEIKHTIDKKTGEITNTQLLLKELAPSNAPVKLLGQPAHILNELQAYIDAKQPIALPIRQGTLDNGNVWRGLDDADILPISSDFVHKKQLEEFNRLRHILFPSGKFEDLSDFPAPASDKQSRPQPTAAPSVAPATIPSPKAG